MTVQKYPTIMNANLVQKLKALVMESYVADMLSTTRLSVNSLDVLRFLVHFIKKKKRLFLDIIFCMYQ